MAARGPQSLLDRREADRETHVVRDRLTRQRSPARSPCGRSNSCGNEGEEEICVRISQPYRTSFSAVLPPSRGKKERSRSTSPGCSSLKGSDRSRSKSPGGRQSRPKHVRYSDRVVIRETGTSDSVGNLLDKDMNNTSGYYSANSTVLSADNSKTSVVRADNSKMSQDTSQERDYSSELRELSQQIVREYSYPKDRENSVEKSSRNHNAQTPNGNVSIKESRSSHVVKPKTKQAPAMVVKDSYDHDRSISYRAAIKDHYSTEVRQKADALLQEEPPVVRRKEAPAHSKPSQTKVTESDSFERRSSLPVEKDDTSNRLTPSKRSISASIGNFFRRLSPHLPRRSKKGNLSNASSVSLSPDDRDLDRPFNKHASTGNLSRGKLRRSFQKLFGGKSKRGSKSAREDRSVDDLSQEVSDNQNKTVPSSVYMKSIEQGAKSDDMYHKFKNRNTNRSGEAITPVRAQAMKPSKITAPGSEPELDQLGMERSYEKISGRRSQGSNSLDIKWLPKTTRSLQGSQMSGISIDGDSIGECSINPNLSGSEPSLASQASASKQVVVSEKDEVIPSIHSPLQAATPSQGQNDVTDGANKANDVNAMPKLSDEELYPDVHESPRTPSYLKISSAVSGYGHYSKYSAYTGIERRSPYSSTLSLRSSRSDLATPVSPDMPIGKIPNIQPPTNYPPLKTQIISQKQAEQYENEPDLYVNGHTISNGAIEPQLNGENGHVPLVGNFSTTGDSVKDADYFLQVTQSEENRLQTLCSLCEIELLNESLPEEASGRLRAAVGKANLLISQKFRQFQDLCQQHKHPEEGGKRTKWQDLQGFWEMVKIQVDNVDEMFTEIELLRQNGWREIKALSRRSSSSSRSSPKSQSGSLSVSNTSTPSHTPGSKRKGIKVSDTPEQSPERTQKAKMAARAREEARKKMLAEKRAALKQQKLKNNDNIEIYVADSSKSNTPEGTPERTQSREGSHDRERSEEKERTPDMGTSVDADNGGTSV